MMNVVYAVDGKFAEILSVSMESLLSNSIIGNDVVMLLQHSIV